MDYHLLRAYFEDPSKWGPGIAWTPAQFGAVEGNQLPVDAIVSDIGFFSAIVPTHSWRDRVATVQIARRAGMDTCCGGIVGLGETLDDLLDLAFALRELDVDSVPVNFLDARPGTPLAGYPLVEPGFALRALCMFRFVHPRTDLRVAGGREITLRALQVMALYPANSIFTQGYLTTPGATAHHDHQMIRDAGFELELASGETVPADPDAVAHLGAAARRPGLPVARS